MSLLPILWRALSGLLSLVVAFSKLVAVSAISAGLTAAATGDLDDRFTPRLDGSVISVAVQRDGKVLIGGGFTRVGDANREWTARLNGVTGSLDSSFVLSADPFGSYGQCVLPSGNLLVYGNFTRIGSINRPNVAFLTPNGALISSFNPAPNAPVFTVQPLPNSGGYFMGGSFSEMGNQSRRQLARVQTTGTLNGAFTLPANQSVLTSAMLSDGRIVIGGMFTTIGGQVRERLARLEADGSLDPQFAPVFDNAVYCIALQPDGKILVGGDFTTVNGTPRRYLARLHPDGALDEEFQADLTGTDGDGVSSLVLQCDGRILFSGSGFSAVRSVGRTQLARVDPFGHPDPSFNPYLENPTITFGVQDVFTTLEGNGDVLISGSFSIVNGQARQGLARLKNDPSVVSLITTVPDRVEWHREGSAPEIHRAEFELSRDGGKTWTPLGRGSRFDGGWELNGLSLPSGGHIRATGLVQGAKLNASISLVQSVQEFVAPARVLAVHDGPSTASPILASGQNEPVAFGDTRLLVPLTRAFTFANSGTADLQLTRVDVPTGFRTFNVPVLPHTIGAGQSLTVAVQMTSSTVGVFEGAMVIQSNDDASPEYSVPLRGRVTAPEIDVFAGSPSNGQEITSGQLTPIDLGPTLQGVPGVRRFTLVNEGTAALLVQSATGSQGVEVDIGALPRVLEAGNVLEFEVLLTAMEAGVRTGSVRIDSDDPDESVFEFPVSGEVVLPALSVESLGEGPELNPLTGLWERSMRVSNATAASVPAYQLKISDLPLGVTVANATSVDANGTASVFVREPLGPFRDAKIVLEFRVPDGAPGPGVPSVAVEWVPVLPDDGASNQPPYAEIGGIARLADNSILLDIVSATGLQYEVQYSSDGMVWRKSAVPLSAAGNRTPWIDRGPPRTHRSPGVDPIRLYRVRIVTP